MGQRSRKRRREGGPRPDRMAELYARGRARDEEARQKLVPLAEGERPRAVTISAVVAATLAVANVAAAAVVDNKELGDWQQVILGSTILLIAAGGLWLRKYWGVLGFMVILLFAMLGAARLLLVATNAWAFLLCFVMLGGGGALFFSLIKALARIQMPQRPARD